MAREPADSSLNENRTSVHTAVLKAVAIELGTLPSVLKGGSALIFCYGHTRSSEDLDYNSHKHHKLDTRIRNALQNYGATQVKIDVVKDTATTLRYRVTYSFGAIVDAKFKVETSFREGNESDSAVTVDGIRVYPIDALANQKLAAITGRTAARDLQDIHFIIENHRSKIQDATFTAIRALVGDGSALISKYADAYENDNSLTEEDLLSTVQELLKLTK